MLTRRILFVPHINMEAEKGYVENPNGDNVLLYMLHDILKNEGGRKYCCICYSRESLELSRQWARKRCLTRSVKFVLYTSRSYHRWMLHFYSMLFVDIYVATPYRSIIAFKWPWQRIICLNYFSSFKNDALADINSVKNWSVDYAFTTSLLAKQILCYSEKIDYEKVHVTGFPRNDKLFEPRFDRDFFNKRFGLAKGSNIILYAPTHRDQLARGAQSSFITHALPSGKSLDKLLEVLRANDSYLFIKVHPKEKIPIEIQSQGRIIIWNANRNFTVYDFLPYVSLCISDYSSIVLDFMLLRKPILLYAFDLDEYRTNRGLSFNPLKLWMSRNMAMDLNMLSLKIDSIHKSNYQVNYSDYDISEFHSFEEGSISRIQNIIGA